ncbi:hypothetical protein GCM10007973_30420 [Polymorphobacter multimanifer]|nr:heme-dependent oxidative N-demethylase subunit alpha family protein [Polymorphobacter multimanifer]GGI92127.1 hypothetical protein GCM10007973_30420 [Polymorphobacter multimanifer]
MPHSAASLAPFRRHHATLRLGLTRLDMADWLDSAPDMAARLALRRARLARHPDALQALAHAGPAVAEFAARVGAAAPTLEAIATTIHEDVMLLERHGEQHRLLAGILLFPSDWRVADMIGKPVAAIHARVPGFGDRLAAPIEHILGNLDQPLQRANWAITETPDLVYAPDLAPALRFGHITPENAGSALALRVERQTLTRMPETGSIAFTIGIHTAALDSLPLDLLPALLHALGAMPAAEAARRAVAAFAPAIRGWAAQRMNA